MKKRNIHIMRYCRKCSKFYNEEDALSCPECGAVTVEREYDPAFDRSNVKQVDEAGGHYSNGNEQAMNPRSPINLVLKPLLIGVGAVVIVFILIAIFSQAFMGDRQRYINKSKEYVTSRLLNPDSAKFADDSRFRAEESAGGGQFGVLGYIEAEDKNGEKIVTSFTIIYDLKNGKQLNFSVENEGILK